MQHQVKLKVKDGFFGCFQLDNQNTLVAPIINLSADKALIALSKTDLKTVQAGDRVSFSRIIGATNLCFDDRIPTKIHWIKDLNHSHYMAAAFNFCELEETVRNQIVCFVESERSTRGQYS